MSNSSFASILVVDDDQRTLMAMRALLQCLGQNLVLANSGEEALRCVLKDDFAVILLDARMPGIDGFETRSALSRAPVMILVRCSAVTKWGRWTISSSR